MIENVERIEDWERIGGDFTSWECRDGLWTGSSVTFERNAYEKHPWITVADRNDYAVTTIPLPVLEALLSEQGLSITPRAELAQLRARIEELIEQSESWRRGVVAWQAWAEAVIDPANQPDGGKLGDRCAQACIDDELRAAREELSWRRKRDGAVEVSAAATMARLREEKAVLRARIEGLEREAKHYEQECGMCGATTEDLIEFAEWQQERRGRGEAVAADAPTILTIHRGGPIGGGPQR